jgi:hypothetical protein
MGEVGTGGRRGPEGEGSVGEESTGNTGRVAVTDPGRESELVGLSPPGEGPPECDVLQLRKCDILGGKYF